MEKINFEREDIKEYLEETRKIEGREIKIHQIPGREEKDLLENIENIGTLPENIFANKNDNKNGSGMFKLLKRLDGMLMDDEKLSELGDVHRPLSGKEIEEILKYIYIQKYVEANAEEEKDAKNLNKALKMFISEMYDSGVHFFEEILQNIDDAIGRIKDSSKNDEVVINWTDKKITFSYPDRGFSFYDLEAITSLGYSSKKGDLEHASIGEKGIGFKSIFSVAEQVDIKSKYFSFGIKYYRDKDNEDMDRKTSVLQPDYIVLNESDLDRTELTITFFDDDKFSIEDKKDNEGKVIRKGFKTLLKEWLFENKKEDYLNYSPFLFLKKYKKYYIF